MENKSPSPMKENEKSSQELIDHSSKKVQSDLTGAWKRFILSIVGVIVLFILAFSLGMSLRNQRLLRDEIQLKAESLIESVVLARRWNSHHGGVFVEKKEGIKSSPFLENPDISTVDGRVYTIKTPELMTAEISRLSKGSKLFNFKITSLKPLNPANRPGDFERDALLTFEKGVQNAERVQEGPELGKYRYKYMVPLVTEKECLQCHEKQGYKVGSVRGGISVDFDVTPVQKSMSRHRTRTWLLGGSSAVVILVIVSFLVLGLKKSLDSVHGD